MKREQQPLLLGGFEVYQSWLDVEAQAGLLDAARAIATAAPLFSPVTRFGKPMSVSMTSAGQWGWVADQGGYRYAPRHPGGSDWPPIPTPLLDIWQVLTGLTRLPDSCLINFYDQSARMGLHQDRDEASFDWPVLSISLGDDALFRIGGVERRAPTQSVWLRSGDIVLMGGAARLCHHGVDRIRHGSSRLLPDGGRVNLTLRVVEK